MFSADLEQLQQSRLTAVGLIVSSFHFLSCILVILFFLVRHTQARLSCVYLFAVFIFRIYEEPTNRFGYSGTLLSSLPYRKGLRNNDISAFSSRPVVGTQSLALSGFKNIFLACLD